MRTVQAGFKTGRGAESAADLLERVGPTLLVDLGLRSLAPAGEPPDLPVKGIRALLDTGAGMDGIDENLALGNGCPGPEIASPAHTPATPRFSTTSFPH